jgi:hypothetical protein
MTATNQPVLYVVVCGAPPATEVPALLVGHAQAVGWDVCAILSPIAVGFLQPQQVSDLAELTGHTVRSQFKQPGTPDVLPPPDAILVAPATFNTVNKIANGISDTLAVAVVCEALGAGKPTVIAPWQNQALSSYPAYGRSIGYLLDAGAHLILTDRTRPAPAPDAPRDGFPWPQVRDAVEDLLALVPPQP